MSSPAHSNISQNDTKILEKQQQEIQQRHKEKQCLLVQIEEVAKLCQAEHVDQKARREAEEKARKEAERWRRRRGKGGWWSTSNSSETRC